MSENPLIKCNCGLEFQDEQIEEIIGGKMRYCQHCGMDLTSIKISLIEEQQEKEKNPITKNKKTNGLINKLQKNVEDRVSDAKNELIEELKETIDDEIEEMEDEMRENIEEAQEKLDEANENIDDILDRLEDAKERSKEAWEKVGEAQQENKDAKKIAKAILKAEKVDRKIEKLQRKKEKYEEKANEAKKKAEYARINFTLPKDMKSDWKDLANRLRISVSELVRTAVGSLEDNLGDLEQFGEDMERSVKESGIEDLGEQLEKAINGKFGVKNTGKKGRKRIEVDFSRRSPGKSYHTQPSQSSQAPISPNKDQIKKRVKGIIKLQKNLPIDKFAQSLDKDEKFAENLIFEAVGEGLLDGELENNVFKFTNDPDEVISIISDMIDNLF